MGSCMASRLNYFSPRVADVNFCYFITVPSGGGCWYYAKCEMQNGVTQDRWWNEHEKLWIFREIANWRQWQLMLHGWRQCHGLSPSFSKRWHVADVKTSPELTRQPYWSIEIPQISHIPSDFTFVYVYKIATDALQLTATAVAMDSRNRFSKKWHIADIKNISGIWPGDPNGRLKFRKYHAYHPILCLFTFTISRLMLCSWWRLLEIAQTAHSRRQKHRQQWPGSIKIPELPKFMPTRSSKTFRKTSSLLLGCCHYDAIAH